MSKRERGLIEKPDTRRAAVSSVLQNMSCAPYSEIRHSSPFRRPNGRGLVFACPPGRNPLAKLLKTSVAAALGLTDPGDAERALRRRIDAHAFTLPIPAAALVTDRAEPEDEPCDELLSIATVLSKSSGHVYLRDKAPNLSQIKPGRRVVLIVPGERRAK